MHWKPIFLYCQAVLAIFPQSCITLLFFGKLASPREGIEVHGSEVGQLCFANKCRSIILANPWNLDIQGCVKLECTNQYQEMKIKASIITVDISPFTISVTIHTLMNSIFAVFFNIAPEFVLLALDEKSCSTKTSQAYPCAPYFWKTVEWRLLIPILFPSPNPV